ncbi:dynein heavy chain 9, axonemal isoform X2 [Anabas testudineus]|uniref:dynein heavy chain 9, axonemal isoform X2 n=1 Tax=Anabas testudineus TaxID=64144 RepID=UPI000E464ECC|nr:dynein heavy chain 9, axonemal isoform X2 [Anabas testudineus]
MEAKEDRLDPVRSFAVTSLRLEEDSWKDLVSEELNQVMLSSFCSAQDHGHLFVFQQPDSGLSVSLDFPKHIKTKVICVSKTEREAVTKENSRKILMIQEVRGDDVLSFIISVTEQVICPLLSNLKNSCRWAVGVADEALRFMERQKNEALVMKAKIEGRTFLPQPAALHDDHGDGHGVDGHHDDGHHDEGRNNDDLCDDDLHADDVQDDVLRDDGLYDDTPHYDSLVDDTLQDDDLSDDSLHDDEHHDDSLHDDSEGRELLDMKLLHACDWMIIEWAELVSEVLQQDSSQLVLDGLKPLPSDEFHFWKNRLKNLLFIQQQLMSSSAQQVASIVQKAESVYWATLRDLYRDVQEGVKEAQDVTVNLDPLQQKMEQLEQLDFQQMKHHMASVMEDVCLVWIRSNFYCEPCRMVVLLQEICNLLIQLSRQFLQGKELICGLVSDPGVVLDYVRLVIQTLQTFKEEYNRVRTQLKNQKQDSRVSQSWSFPPHLVFVHLDNFLKHLYSIQEVLIVSLQLDQLNQTMLSGVSGHMWTNVVHGVYQDFLRHVTDLSECNCDPTNPDNQSFKQHLDQFQVQVSDLERRLGSVFSRALQVCSVSSAAKLVKMFGFILNRPVILDKLHPQLIQLKKMVLMDLDQIELLFCRQKGKSDTFSMFTPTATARLCWTQQLRLRAEDCLKSYRTVEHLFVDSGASHMVQERFQQIVDLLQDFRDRLRSDRRSQLDSDCGLILEQPLIQHKNQGILGVSCSHELEAVLRELRYVRREKEVELGPHATRLFSCRDDTTQSYLSLSHMLSCYNQVVSEVLQVELPLIQDQLQDLSQTLSQLQRNSWGCEGVQQLVQQQTGNVLMFHSTVSKARANMDAIGRIIQGWADIDLLQRSGDFLLQDKVSQQSYRRLREEGQELLRLTQVNRTLYKVAESSESWINYLDYIDDQVQNGLFELLLRSLRFLSNNMKPQSCSAAFLTVSLQLQETGSLFEFSAGSSLCDHLKSIISDVYAAASLLPRISAGRHGNYQLALQPSPELSAVEQEVMRHLLQVREETEHLRTGLDRYAHLWQSDRQGVMHEFLTYGTQLGPEDLEPMETPPTLKDFKREIETLHRLSGEVTHLDEVIILHSWLQVDLRPFRDSLLSVIQDWKSMYTEYLLDSVSHSLQQVTQHGSDEKYSSSSRLPLTETIILLEAVGVELPEHLSAQLQC